MKLIAQNTLALAIAGLLFASSGVQAQETKQADAAKLAEWEQSAVHDIGGLRAEYLITEEVFGPKGDEIGNVENAIISDGQIAALVVEVGGFWGIGDTHVVVPWNEVTLTADGFKVPVSEDNYEEYQLFGQDSFVTMTSLQQTHPVKDNLATGSQSWKLTALLDDYVVLNNGAGYGYLNDVVFSKDGEIKALIVDATVAEYGYGTFLFPFYGTRYGWQPYDNFYTLPYGPAAIGTLDPFDYGVFNGYWY